MLKIQCPCGFSLFCGVEIKQLSLLSIGKKHEISNKMEHGIYFLRRRSKSLLASFFAFEDDGLNLLQFATASGYRLGHMVLRKSEGCRFVKHLVQREIQRKQQVFLSGRARQGGA